MADVETNISETAPLVGTGNVGDPVPNGGLLHQQSGSQKVSKTPGGQFQSGETKSGGPGLKLSTMTRRQKWVLALCTTAMFLVGSAFSLLGPFYPIVAERKGMSITLIGVVFGMFELMIFIFSPIFGNYLTTIGPKFCYVAGIGVGGVCAILFGTLDKCPNGLPFIAISIVCRSVEAFGFSAFVTSSFAIVSSEFPDNIGFVLGLLETGEGMGFALGPALGGVLYNLGGYGLPFYIVGVLILVNGTIMYVFLPTPKHVDKNRRGSIFNLLRSPLVVFPMLSIYAGVLAMTTFVATFAKHLESFHLSVSVVGLLFTIGAVLYSLMSVVWGYFTDKKDIQSPFIVFGNFVLGVSFLIFGPSPLLPFIPFELWTLTIGLVLLGISYGCTMIPTVKCMVQGACELNYENNIDTFAMVSGLFNSVHCLAGFMGPVVLGALVQEFDYPIAYTVAGLVNIFVMIACLVFFLTRYVKRKRKSSSNELAGDCTDESEHLTKSDSNVLGPYTQTYVDL